MAFPAPLVDVVVDAGVLFTDAEGVVAVEEAEILK